MTDHEEQDFVLGHRAALAGVVSHCVRELGYAGRTAESFVAEREAVIPALRRICAEHGDNDWPDDLHLADIIEKHLAWHLLARAADR